MPYTISPVVNINEDGYDGLVFISHGTKENGIPQEIKNLIKEAESVSF